MGYTSYKIFTALTDDKGVIIDGCGNTHEDKYYFNGMYIDLCGLPIEEYMKNPWFCNNSGGSTPSKQENIILITYTEAPDNKYEYQAVSTYPVETDMQIKVVSPSGTMFLTIPRGKTASEKEVVATNDYDDVELNVTEDDKYVYVSNVGGSSDFHTVYSMVLLAREISAVDSAVIRKGESFKLKNDEFVQMTYVITASNLPTDDMADEEFAQYVIDYEHALGFSLPKELYDNGRYSLKTLVGDEKTSEFISDGKTYIIDEKPYVFLYNRKEGSTALVAAASSDKVFEYILTITK